MNFDANFSIYKEYQTFQFVRIKKKKMVLQIHKVLNEKQF